MLSLPSCAGMASQPSATQLRQNPTEGVGLTGGVGLFGPRHLQLEPLPAELYSMLSSEGLMRHRFGGARLRCRGLYVNFIVVYLVSGGEFSLANLSLLRHINLALGWLSGPAIVMGDF